ncbi:MAG TPA: PhnD/SsuA/transferrin family substrate-binding protein, partial [Anaerolineales bacterium]
ACTLPVSVSPAVTESPTVQPTALTAVPLQPTAQPGTEGNPLILALAPAAQNTTELVQTGQSLAARLQSLTGYNIALVAPTSEQETLRAISAGNIQIAVLSPFAYLEASRKGEVSPLLSRVRDGEALYGAQFIARSDTGFKSYFDSARGENTAEAPEALLQFQDRKPCWSDPASPSGYVVPLGFLKQAGVTVREPAFVEGQPTVVRAVYGKGICDFGATYIDARRLRALEDDYPDVLEKVLVIWQIPAVIPYEVVAAASGVNPEIQRSLLRAFIDIMNTPDGKLLIQTVYGIDAFQPAGDSLYHDFGTYVDASGLDLNTLIK